MIHEQLDDLPVLLAHLERLEVSHLVDQHFPAHGNWRGCSLGKLTTVWLTHVLSQGDHRLNHVQPWAAQRLEALRRATGSPFTELDFTDDRLAVVLRRFSDDPAWQAFEERLNRQLVRVYALPTREVRLDTTTAWGERPVTAEGLFQFGVSKDHRPDLPQLKIALATLDPLGMPLVTAVLPGQRADDPLYLPLVEGVRRSLDQRGLLYVGDCKMASLGTRAGIHAGQDFYLCPLPETQLPPAELERYLTPVWKGEQALTTLSPETIPAPRPLEAPHALAAPEAPPEAASLEARAEGFELHVRQTAEVAGEVYTWHERRLVVRNLVRAGAATAALERRLAAAEAALGALNARGRGKRRFASLAAGEKAAAKVLQRYQVHGLLQVTWSEQVEAQEVRAYRGRAAQVRITRDYRLQVRVDEAAVTRTKRLLGWRVYATQAPPEQLDLAHAVRAYANQYRIERSFERLKGQPLSLTPLYLQREDHVVGLIRLLMVALRVLCVVEYQARQYLAAQGAPGAPETKIAGLYAGNPKRATARPTAELLLAAFRGIALVWIGSPQQSEGQLSRFSAHHEQLLKLWGLSSTCYTRLRAHSPNPP